MCKQMEGLGTSSFSRETKAALKALISACLGDVVEQTRINRDQNLSAFKEHLMHVRRKSWAFPH